MPDTKSSLQTAATPAPTQELDIEFWAKTWAKDDTFWQVFDIHPVLLKYLDRLVGVPVTTLEEAQAAAKDKKIFVPLCGKTRDIAHLLRLGFRVFAIEYVRKAIEELDQENGFRLQFDADESVFRTADGRLVIYNGDMYECPIEKWGPFECVWDRASFCAVDYDLRPKYADVMRRSVLDSSGGQVAFRYLLETFNCDRAVFAGPPRAVSMEDIRDYFGGWARHEMLEVTALPDKHLMRKAMKMTPAVCMVSFFTPK